MKQFFTSVGFKILFIMALFTVMVTSGIHLFGLHSNSGGLFRGGDKHEVEEKLTFSKAPPEIQKIFDTMVSSLGSKADGMRLKIGNTDDVNAYMDSSGNLVLFQGLLNFSIRDNKDITQVESVMAHEIAHWTLYHTRSSKHWNDNLSEGRNAEREADVQAVKILYDAGYSCKGGANFFEAIGARWGYSPTSPYSSHPGDVERIKTIEEACDVYRTTGVLVKVHYELVVPDPVANSDITDGLHIDLDKEYK